MGRSRTSIGRFFGQPKCLKLHRRSLHKVAIVSIRLGDKHARCIFKSSSFKNDPRTKISILVLSDNLLDPSISYCLFGKVVLATEIVIPFVAKSDTMV